MRLSDLSGYPSCRVQVNLKNHKLSFLEGDFWGIGHFYGKPTTRPPDDKSLEVQSRKYWEGEKCVCSG